jgi:hypothetical protein
VPDSEREDRRPDLVRVAASREVEQRVPRIPVDNHPIAIAIAIAIVPSRVTAPMKSRRILELLIPGLFGAASFNPSVRTPTVLGRVLGRGRVFTDPAESWESLLSLRLGFRQPDAGLRNGFAWPVRFIPGIRDMVVQPVPALTPEEWIELRAAADPEFAALGAEWTYAGREPLEFMLAGAGIWEGLPPSVAWNRAVRVYPLNQPIQRRIQVFLSALPMVWTAHSVNQERTRANLPEVQSLWLWSPGIPAELPDIQQVAASSALAHRLCEIAGVACSDDLLNVQAQLTVIDSLLRFRDGPHREEILESISEDLLYARLRQLNRGRFETLVIRDPGVLQVHLSRWEARRFWRRSAALQDIAKNARDA